MSEWRPIETAPARSLDDEAQSILLWVADGGDKKGQGVVSLGYCYRSHDGSVKARANGFWGDWRVTHWMPLPPPPTALNHEQR